MLAYDQVTQKMLHRATKRKLSDDLGTLQVIRPEDLIGLKLMAARNNPKRAGRDMVDVQEFIKHTKAQLDYSLLKEYFIMSNKEENLKEFWKNAF